MTDQPSPLTPEEKVRRLLRGQFAYCINPEDYYPGDITHDYDDIIEQAIATLGVARAGVRDPEGVFWDEKAHEIEAAASRPAPDPSTALDVERLARAMAEEAASRDGTGLGWATLTGPVRDLWRTSAAAIAREYAALAAESREDA